jgi:AcrR family transcriptional regulator
MGSSIAQIPVGRRERQKITRRRRIVTAARRLFARRGYGSTAIEDVAAAAGLAVGTVYNYFPSKSDLLAAIIRRETEKMIECGRRVLDDPPADPVAAIIAIADIFIGDFVDADRALWRELMSAALSQPLTVGRRLFESDAQLVALAAQLIEQFQARGALARDLNPMRAATVLYGICFTWVNAYLMSDAVSIEIVRDEIHRGIEIVARGLLPRDAGAPS